MEEGLHFSGSAAAAVLNDSAEYNDNNNFRRMRCRERERKRDREASRTQIFARFLCCLFVCQ